MQAGVRRAAAPHACCLLAVSFITPICAPDHEGRTMRTNANEIDLPGFVAALLVIFTHRGFRYCSGAERLSAMPSPQISRTPLGPARRAPLRLLKVAEAMPA